MVYDVPVQMQYRSLTNSKHHDSGILDELALCVDQGLGGEPGALGEVFLLMVCRPDVTQDVAILK